MTDHDDLSPEEARALKDLAAGPEPPASLENAAVERLRSRGLIAGRGPGAVRWLAAAAAGIALFAAGLYLGSPRPKAPAAAEAALTRYVLFLYDAPGEAALSPAAMDQRIDEYRNWARAVRVGGSEIHGEKLASESRVLGPPGTIPGPALGGYFVISAKDEQEALAIARTCPHRKHGGTIVVRRVEKT